MTDLVSVAIVGCGGMGRRHLGGLAELARIEHNNIRLAAVCDLDERKAELLADEALTLLGVRPKVFTDARRMAKEVEGLAGADCTTDTPGHHRVSAALLKFWLEYDVRKAARAHNWELRPDHLGCGAKRKDFLGRREFSS